MAANSLLEKGLVSDESVRIKGVELTENCVRAFFPQGQKMRCLQAKVL